jgi:hypothetical protein
MCVSVLILQIKQPITNNRTKQKPEETEMMNPKMTQITKMLCVSAVLTLGACTSAQKAPATADVAVSENALENAVSAGAAELAPVEITAAREKMMLANQALAAKDYALARDLAAQAQADARLAQSKANSTKASAAAAALNDDLRVLREEVERANQ